MEMERNIMTDQFFAQRSALARAYQILIEICCEARKNKTGAGVEFGDLPPAPGLAAPGQQPESQGNVTGNGYESQL